jgi:hypothetical protein
MAEESKYRMECGEFEAVLSEAVEGELRDSRAEAFDAHRMDCALCGALFAEVEAGRDWLQSLEQIEPPAHLVHNILASTTGIESSRLQISIPEVRGATLGERLRARWDSIFVPTAAFVRQPRFVMSFGMIFFSFSLALSAAGVKPEDVKSVDLHPSAIKHAFYSAQIRVVKFYDNIRFVYEIQARVREFKRATTPAEPAPQRGNHNRKNDTSGQPDQKQERNYSREENQPVLAGLRNDRVSAVPVASYGRQATDYRARRTSEPALSLEFVARSQPAPPDVTVTTNRRYV